MYTSQKILTPADFSQLAKTNSMRYAKLQLTIDIESLNAIPDANRQSNVDALIREMKRLGKEAKLPFRIDLILPSNSDYFNNNKTTEENEQ